MDLLSKDELTALIDEHEKPCISMYFPTIRAGAEIQQNPIRFKNLIREAEDRLATNGWSEQDARGFTEPAWDLLNDEDFWQNQSDGLAVFLSPDFFTYFRLPLNFAEKLIISDMFHVRPMLPLFSNNGRFYILALSMDQVHLLEGTRYSVDEVEVEDLPKSLAEALRWDDYEETLRFHVSEGGQGGSIDGKPTTMFHGHGGGGDEERKVELRRYFQKVAKALEDLLGKEQAPLVLAGVEYLFPIYRKASSYNHLVEEGIPGNPDEVSPKELHNKAWEILEPFFKQEQEKAAALYEQQAGMETGRASDDLNEIIPAAFNGRVGQLFVPLGTEQWGTYDWATTQVELHDEQSISNRDLLDMVAAQTFLNDGVVYVVKPDELPAAPVAAVFRY